MIETASTFIDDEDSLTDLMFFDTASSLWNQEWVDRLFSGRVELTDWPGQPAVGFPHGTIENA
jgi:hypothetical protein